MQRKVIRGIVRYSISTATAAVIVAVYFRWLHVNETTVAMTFLVGILLVAANWGLRHSIYLSILSAAAFNFFFLPPILTFTIGEGRNWIALLAFLVTGIVIDLLNVLPQMIAATFNLAGAAVYLRQRDRVYRSSPNYMDVTAAELRDAAFTRDHRRDE